eukprot:6469776-Amphidinium_carterae.1
MQGSPKHTADDFEAQHCPLANLSSQQWQHWLAKPGTAFVKGRRTNAETDRKTMSHPEKRIL